MRSYNRRLQVLLFLFLVGISSGVFAQEKDLDSMSLEELLRVRMTVTGTRVEGRTATETPAPVDLIDRDAIESTGATETGKVLQLLAPSFNFSTTTISDGTDIIRPATLRGLGPDQVLVLVNGKRRHQQALLNVQQSIGRGSAGYDINTIPVSAIERIEILRDGAAAQYGSDAIAGVINIILRGDTNATDLAIDAGQTFDGDGEVGRGAFNSGFRLGSSGYGNLTVEVRDRGETNRAGVDTIRVTDPHVTMRIGDPDAEEVAIWINGSLPAGPGEIYSFGGFSRRQGNSSGFFRPAEDDRTVPAVYPNGFLPTILTEPHDMSLVSGYRGETAGGWSWDLAGNWGRSEFSFREENTINVSYWYEPTDPSDPTGPRFEQSPTAADTGTLEYDQLSLTFDLKRQIDWSSGAGPLYFAAGTEWREEGYEITPGDPVSYQYGRMDDRSIPILNQNGEISQPGTQGFPGWSPREAVDGSRRSLAAYVDLESQITDAFRGGAAVRFEDYSDFGNTLTGKLSGRYEINDSYSLRGTVSTGFRAPSVHQIYYSQRSTALNAAGVLTDTLTARQNSDLTAAFGIPPLEEETSVNYSLGFVALPSPDLRVTLDLYRIDIDDRIVFSANIQPEDPATCGEPSDPVLCPIKAILDPFGAGQVLFFTNAIDTRTTGFDLVAEYKRRLGGSRLTLQGALHVNDTEVRGRRSSSEIIPPEVLFDHPQITLIEEGQPGERVMLSGSYERGPWTTDLRFNYFGKVAGEGFTPGFRQTWGGKWLTDLSFSYELTKELSLTAGGLNIFDVFPDEWDKQNAFPLPQFGFVYGWETLPFGINGGYWFARLGYRFDH